MEAVENLAARSRAGSAEGEPAGGRGGAAARRHCRRAGGGGGSIRTGCSRRKGRRALDYLRGRGLTDETIRKFGLGWSGEGTGALAAALRGRVSGRSSWSRPG